MLVIDSQEKPPKYVQELQGLIPDGDTQVRALPAGDYLYCYHPEVSLEYSPEHTLIERKKVGDLISSFIQRNANGERRLVDQLKRCSRLAGRVILLVEGTMRPMVAPGWLLADKHRRRFPYMAAQGVLLSLQAEMEVKVIWTQTSLETQMVLAWLHSYLKRSNHGSWA